MEIKINCNCGSSFVLNESIVGNNGYTFCPNCAAEMPAESRAKIITFFRAYTDMKNVVESGSHSFRLKIKRTKEQD